MLNKYLISVKLENARILKATYKFARILVPLGITKEQFYKKMEGLEMALQVPISIKHDSGRIFNIKIAEKPLGDDILYDEMLVTKPLAVPLCTPFGETIFMDFSDEVCCHLLIGGATRMGKTVLLRLIVTHILRKTEGKVAFVFLDNKITDLMMFTNIPQITIGETVSDAIQLLRKVTSELDIRKELVKKSGKVDGRHLEPLFVIIDEYGRFADDKTVQDMVTVIAETAGYLNIHLVIATQRPDATSAIKPRIKANLVTRFAFTTADEANSQIILGTGDAAHLGRIQGRAIFMDGFPNTVQVPYISADFAKELVKPYVIEPRQTDSREVAAVSSPVPQAFGADDFHRIPQSTRNSKSRSKKTGT